METVPPIVPHPYMCHVKVKGRFFKPSIHMIMKKKMELFCDDFSKTQNWNEFAFPEVLETN